MPSPYAATIREISDACYRAAGHAGRPERIVLCRRKQDDWLRRREAHRAAAGALTRFDPTKVRAARLSAIAEARARAWGALADGDAAGAWWWLVLALRLEAPITRRRPPAMQPELVA